MHFLQFTASNKIIYKIFGAMTKDSNVEISGAVNY